jgi:hypothetical protein
MKGPFPQNRTLDTIDDMTDARSGLSTVSTAKKRPTTTVETYTNSRTSEGSKHEKKVA